MTISRRNFLKSAGIASAVMLASTPAGLTRNAVAHAADAKQGKPGKKPNLLIVFPDQMRATGMGFVGVEPVITPNLDKLAKQSMVFTQAVSNHPVCSPYRAMLMTGKYSFSNKVNWNCNSGTTRLNCELQKSDTCFSDVLNNQGYSTGYIGKWHLDSPRAPFVKTYNNRNPKCAWNEWCSPDRRHGFQFWHAYGTYDMHNSPKYWKTDAKRSELVQSPKWGPEYEADLAIEFLKNTGGQYRSSDKPFCLVVSMNPPHGPHNQVPRRYVDMYKGKKWQDLQTLGSFDRKSTSWVVRRGKKDLKNYFAQITGVDDQFGRILKTLDDLKLADDTLVLFTADHGHSLGCHEENSKNHPHEESLIVPFMVRYPGKIKPGKSDILISAPDVAPTLLDLLGQKPNTPAAMEGTSYAPAILGKKQSKPSSAFYFRAPKGLGDDYLGYGERGVRTNTHTLVVYKYLKKHGKKKFALNETALLYDNRKDPWQLKNIASDNQALIDKLIDEEIIPWMRKTKDPWLGVHWKQRAAKLSPARK